jgi:1,2-diacylglycerol 3-alpha-glucosyltransferase
LGHGTNEPTEFLQRIEFLQHLAPWHLEQLQASGVWRPTWTAIPNFVDVQSFRPGSAPEIRAELGIPPDAQLILTVAAVKRGHKRVHHLVEEFAALRSRRPDLPLWLVVAGGKDAESEELVTWGKGLLLDRVRFLIGYPRVRMPELYRSANLFAFCSLREMMPMALVEATASGLPCIVHDHPIMQWICGSGAAVIDMEDRGALAQAIEVLTEDGQQSENLGLAARRRCVGQFSDECVIGQVLDYYHFAVGRDAGKAGPRENASGRAASDAGRNPASDAVSVA